MKSVLSKVVIVAILISSFASSASADMGASYSLQDEAAACYAEAKRLAIIEMTYVSVGSIRNQNMHGRSATPMADNQRDYCNARFGVNQYEGNCRFDTDRDAAGNRCGGRSAYSRDGGLY